MVTAIVPYFGYAKGDKKDEHRVSIREGMRGLSWFPVPVKDIQWDASAQVQGFFQIPVDHLLSLPILREYIK